MWGDMMHGRVLTSAAACAEKGSLKRNGNMFGADVEATCVSFLVARGCEGENCGIGLFVCLYIFTYVHIYICIYKYIYMFLYV